DRFSPGKTQKPKGILNRAACYCRDTREIAWVFGSVNGEMKFFVVHVLGGQTWARKPQSGRSGAGQSGDDSRLQRMTRDASASGFHVRPSTLRLGSGAHDANLQLDPVVHEMSTQVAEPFS